MADKLPENQVSAWAHDSLDMIKRYELLPIPDNFAIFYHYFAGTNPNLKMAVDALLYQFGTISQLQCTEIYQTHLGLEAEFKVLKNTNSAIEGELGRVLGMLDKSSTEVNNYNQTLTTFTGKLENTTSVEVIREAVTRVADETRSMSEQNTRLHAQLALSTQQLAELRYNLDEVKRESLIDPLTEIGNRKFFNNELTRVVMESIESHAPLALLMIDIDHFKKFNDTYGHLIGDQVLRLVAKTLIENLKGRDIIARFGGEEFVILLPNTRVGDAEKVGDQLRTSLGSKQLRRKNSQETLGAITISIGTTEYIAHEEFESFIARADGALYEAKQTGRNKVIGRAPTPEDIAAVTVR